MSLVFSAITPIFLLVALGAALKAKNDLSARSTISKRPASQLRVSGLVDPPGIQRLKTQR